MLNLKFEKLSNNESSSSPYRLLELSKEMEGYLLNTEKDNALVIKGNDNDDAVCCTENKSFLLRKVEISNTLLLLNEDLNNEKEQPKRKKFKTEYVDKLPSFYYELVNIPPKLEKLKEILYQAPLTSNSGDDVGYSFDELKSRIQASDTEILEGLKKLNAFEHNNLWQVLSKQLLHECFEMVLTELESSPSFTLDNIKLDTMYDALNGIYPQIAIKQAIKIHSKPNDLEDNYSLDKKKVGIFCATLVLEKGNTKVDTFMNAWNSKLPHGMIGDLEWIGNISTIDGDKILYINHDVLPRDVKKRFLYLFKLKKSWDYAEILPFIEPVLNGKRIKDVFRKYSRLTLDKTTRKKIVNAKF
jgi:sister chromatid cohesion protein DCC1